MKTFPRHLFLAWVFTLPMLVARADSYDLSLREKAEYCNLVAEVTVTGVTKRRSQLVEADEWTIDCTILNAWKSPTTNRQISLTTHIYTTNIDYVGSTVVVLAFLTEDGSQWRPFNAQLGLVREGDLYTDYTAEPDRKLRYDELVRELRDIFAHNDACVRMYFESWDRMTIAAASNIDGIAVGLIDRDAAQALITDRQPQCASVTLAKSVHAKRERGQQVASELRAWLSSLNVTNVEFWRASSFGAKTLFEE